MAACSDQDEHGWVSDVEVAEITFTAFTSRRHSEHIGARLVVRRVKALNPATVPAGQGALYSTWRHHAVLAPARIACSARRLRLHLPAPVEDPDRPAAHPRPNPESHPRSPVRHHQRADRWIQVQEHGLAWQQ